MATAYKKFSGRSALNVQQAYLGPDHLLVVDGVYQERVKRIDYTDIQAILICPTKGGSILSLIYGLGGLLTTGIALAEWQGGAFVFWLIPALVLWVLFGLGIYQRGSAVFGIQTAVQTVLLPGLSGRRKAERARQLLAERIVAAQGPLDEAALRTVRARRLTSERHAGPRSLAAASPRVASMPPPIQPGERGVSTSGEGAR